MSYLFNLNFRTLILELEEKQYFFVDSRFENIIKTLIKKIFLVLNKEDKYILFILVKNLIEVIATKYNFSQNKDKIEDKYYHQFTQNNYQDIKALLNLTLPYIDDKDNYKKHHSLKRLSDLLVPKSTSTFNKDKLKNLTNNEFEYCNIAYDLLRMEDGNWAPWIDIYDLLANNYYALLHTLEVTTGKLYINWLNIRPLTLKTYKKNYLFKNTKESLLEWSDTNNRIDIENLKNYNGLYIGDIYNTIVQDFYFKIKNAKWLIYVTNSQGKLIENITILNFIIPLKSILLFKNWTELDYIEREILIQKWKKFKENIRIYGGYQEYNNDVIKPLFKYIVVFFRTKYSKKKILINDYPKFKNIVEIKDDDDDQHDKDLKKINELSELELLDAINNIDFEHFYDYFYETIRNIENTYYGKKLIGTENGEPIILNNIILFNKEEKYKYPVIMKNLYNFGKSIYHNNYNNDENTLEWDTKFEFYQSMNKQCKIAFLMKLTGKILINSWFSLKNNYKYIYPDENNYSRYINDIFDQIRINIASLVFENLIYKGILSEFIPEKKLTDDTILPEGYKEQNKYIKNKMKEIVFSPINKENYKNAYYFINKKQYREINNLKIYKKNRYVPADYFTYLAEEQPYWYRFYAMDWICQIQFFHHYIHNRVILVTGSTGQGKSTQAPKLLMYSLVMLGYKDNGKVVCTQPRIPPTVGNANSISSQMGIPIKQYSDTYKEPIRTDNYAIQYKHSKASHVNTRFDSTFLKIVTDGTLFEEMVQNPPMKQQIFGAKEHDYDYGEENKYDIIIVDEAHEHNVNMDFILTVAKNSLYLNNSLKLIIISATIDEDEPIYRRYYREINDNIMYPLNLGSDYSLDLQDNKVVEKKFIDRRYHISPPGKTTLYVIQDIYLQNVEFTNDNVKDSEIAQTESINQALKIARSDPNGEVLLFSIGMGEIKKIVNELNDKLPPGNVALPYYGTMDMKYKDIIQNINKEIKNIHNYRSDIANDWGLEFISNKEVPEGLYKRAIIVATNVAEASVTIPRLKYVIDNGFAKVSKYDIATKTSELVIEKISESSRVQRRGRVGRIADGIVYYMYEKGSKEQISPKYNITNQDISLQLYKLLMNNTYFNKMGQYQKNKQELLILDPRFDPNIFINFDSNMNLLFDEKSKSFDVYNRVTNSNENVSKENLFLFISKFYICIKKQFTLNQKSLSWTYSESEFFESYAINGIRQNYFNNYITGLDISVLLDPDGMFYIIHPNETIFKRNILTGVILNAKELIKKYKNEVKLIEEFFELLIKKLLVVNIIDRIEYTENVEDYLNTNKKYKKTIFGNKIQDLGSTFMFENNYEFVVSMSIPFDCFHEVIIIISMLQASNYGIKEWISTNKINQKIVEFDSFFNIHGDDNSDYITLLNIFQNFSKCFMNLNLFKIYKESNNYLLDPIREKFEKLRKYFYSLKENPDFNITEPPTKKIPVDVYESLIDLTVKGSLFDDKAFEKIFLDDKDLGINLLQEIDNNPSIKTWCDNNYINYQTLLKFTKKYYENIKKVLTINANNENYEEDKLKWFEENLKNFQVNKSNNKKDNIIKSFLFSNPYGIGLKDFSYGAVKNSYLPIDYGNIQKQKPYAIGQRFKGSNELDSSVLYPSDIIFFNTKNEYPNSEIISLSVISNIRMLWLVELFPHIYNPANLIFRPYSSDFKTMFKSPEFVKRVYAKANNIFQIGMLDKFSDKNITPIVNEYYRTIKNNINRM